MVGVNRPEEYDELNSEEVFEFDSWISPSGLSCHPPTSSKDPGNNVHVIPTSQRDVGFPPMNAFELLWHGAWPSY